MWTALILIAVFSSGCAVLIATKTYQFVKATDETCSASIADLSRRLSSMETTERLTPSRLEELAVVRDAIEKGEQLLKRISQREIMRERRAAESVDSFPVNDKNALRIRAGLVAGRPAPHR